MKRAVQLSALVISLMWSSTAARADIPPQPRDLPAGKTPIPIQVSYDSNKDMTFLYIGREALESATGKQNKQSGWTPGPTRSIVAATALSLGLAGVFLLRSRRGAQIACGLVLAVGLGTIGVEAWGNAPAPFPRDAPPGPFPLGDGTPKPINGDAVVEIVDGLNSGRIQLIIGTKPKPQRQFRGPPGGPPGGPPSPANGAPAPNDPFDKKPRS